MKNIFRPRSPNTRFSLKCLALLLFVLTHSFGTANGGDFAQTKLSDPFSGKEVVAYKVVSSSTDLRYQASRYYLVFWPITDEKWLVVSPVSGYTAFYDDFLSFSQLEKSKIQAFLAANYNAKRSPRNYNEWLGWAAQIYKLRRMNDEFWMTFLSLQCYVNREPNSNSSRCLEMAFKMLRLTLPRNKGLIFQMKGNYLLFEFGRRLGRELVSQNCRREFYNLASTATSEEERSTAKFIRDLIEEDRTSDNQVEEHTNASNFHDKSSTKEIDLPDFETDCWDEIPNASESSGKREGEF